MRRERECNTEAASNADSAAAVAAAAAIPADNAGGRYQTSRRVSKRHTTAIDTRDAAYAADAKAAAMFTSLFGGFAPCVEFTILRQHVPYVNRCQQLAAACA